MCLQSVRAVFVAVMACLLKNEPASYCCVARLTRVWGSRSESESEEGVESRGVDPKRSDLPMARVKRG